MRTEPLSADEFLSVLRGAGLKVVEYRSWRTNNRNHVGSFGPLHGVMIHHTVTPSLSGTLDLCYDGRSDLPGPLCHGVIAKDGTIYLVGNGRANHAGSGDGDVLDAVRRDTPLPTDNETDTDGNIYFYGFECINLGDGKDPWPEEQVDSIVRASAALCRAHGWPQGRVIGHLEWQPGKVDPRPSEGPGDVRMGSLRGQVGTWLEDDREGATDMPERALYETKDLVQTVKPNEWTTLDFNRRYEEPEWKDVEPNPSFLFGPAFYSTAIGLEVDNLISGQELQIRITHWEKQEDGTGYERSKTFPISSPTHDSASGKFVHVWNGFVPGEKSGRVRVEVFHMGQAPLLVTFVRAETLYWKK